MTKTQQIKTPCNPFRYLDFRTLEDIWQKEKDLRGETRLLVKEAMLEKFIECAL